MIVDIHQHLGWMPVVSAQGVSSVAENRRRRMEFMDRWGIDQAVILPSNGVPAPRGHADRRVQNDLIADYIGGAPGRFPAGFGTVHPADGDAAVEEVRRCLTDLGFAGIVWHHHFLGTAIDHPGMHDLLDEVQSLGGIAAIHVVAESTLEAPWRLEGLAEAHPDLQFLALDPFSSFAHASWTIQIARRRPNIVFDTGMMASVAHQVVDFVDQVGADRLLLGTDYYCEPELFGQPFPLIEVRDGLGLPSEVIASVLGGNALRLLGL